MFKVLKCLSLIFIVALALSGCFAQKDSSIRRVDVVDRSVFDCTKSYKAVYEDNLARIAKICGADIEKLARLNNINKPYTIKAGQRVLLHKGSVLVKKSKKLKTKKTPMRNSKKVAKNALWVAPVLAKVKTRFNLKKRRRGVEFATNYGQTVYAIRGGIVAYSGNKMTSHGKMVIIKHPANFYSSYTKNSELLVQDGDNVSIGDAIAITGKEPFYMEMRNKSTPVDPIKYIK